MFGLLAVHLSDGVLTWPWLAGGWALALAWLWRELARLQPEDVPAVAVLSAVFFTGSMLHFRVGPASVHLLLNGLVGCVLGTRAVLAVAQGLFLQMLLAGHGGWTTLGLNAVVLALPAALGGTALRRVRRSATAAGVVAGGVALLTVALSVGVLTLGAGEELRTLAPLVTLPYLPVILIEVTVTAAAVGYLARVRPEMLR